MMVVSVRNWFGLGLVVALVVLSGCVSVSSYHTARPVEEGDTEIGVVLETAGSPDSEGVTMSSPRLNVRRGATEELDIGLRAGSFGFGADLNYMFLDTRWLAVSLSPAINYDGAYWFGGDDDGQSDGELDIGTTQQTLLTYYASLLADVASGERATLTLGIKGGAISQPGDEDAGVDSEHAPFFGFSSGVKINIDGVDLMPEVNTVYVASAPGQVFWTAGLGILF